MLASLSYFQPTGALGCDFGPETTTPEPTTTSTTTSTTTTTTADNNWYIFVHPENFELYSADYNYVDLGGQAHKFSQLCNPDWVASDGLGCKGYAFYEYCQDTAYQLVFYATENTNGIWETALQCPQCGCGADGAINLNDRYAEDDDRTVPNRRPRN